MEKIKFSQNWNGKLNCAYYTTIRLWLPQKYTYENLFEIELKAKFIHVAKLISARKLQLPQFTPEMIALDMGCDLSYGLSILRTMYKNQVPNVDTAMFGIYTLHNPDFKNAPIIPKN
jgi:hypothetical protein